MAFLNQWTIISPLGHVKNFFRKISFCDRAIAWMWKRGMMIPGLSHAEISRALESGER
jgi:hypothetical protein